MSAHTRTVKSCAAYALRMAAFSTGRGRSYSAIRDYCRRPNARLGTPKAVTPLPTNSPASYIIC